MPAKAQSDDSLPEVVLFTDGACSGNPGPGGWAFILRHPASEKEIERSGGERRNDQQPHGADGRGRGAAKLSSARRG